MGVNPLFSSAYVSMRCGCPVEIGGFRWKPEENDSYKIDYSSVGAWYRVVFERWRDLKAGEWQRSACAPRAEIRQRASHGRGAGGVPGVRVTSLCEHL